MTRRKQFNEEQYEFILRKCSTPEQRIAVEEINNLCETILGKNLKKYTETREIHYLSRANNKTIVEIYLPKEAPEVLLTLPNLDDRAYNLIYEANYRDKIVKKKHSRYRFEIQSDGKPNQKGTVHKITEFDKKGVQTCQINSIATNLLTEQPPEDDWQKLISLVRLAIEIGINR